MKPFSFFEGSYYVNFGAILGKSSRPVLDMGVISLY
jgi:hypothetical protein